MKIYKFNKTIIILEYFVFVFIIRVKLIGGGMRMKSINFNYQHSLVEQHEIDEIKGQVEAAHNALHKKTGAGKDYTGWVDYPGN